MKCASVIEAEKEGGGRFLTRVSSPNGHRRSIDELSKPDLLMTCSVVMLRRTRVKAVLPERRCVSVLVRAQPAHDASESVSLDGHVFAFSSLHARRKHSRRGAH